MIADSRQTLSCSRPATSPAFPSSTMLLVVALTLTLGFVHGDNDQLFLKAHNDARRAEAKAENAANIYELVSHLSQLVCLSVCLFVRSFVCFFVYCFG